MNTKDETRPPSPEAGGRVVAYFVMKAGKVVGFATHESAPLVQLRPGETLEPAALAAPSVPSAGVAWPGVVRDRLADGWRYTYSASTRFIGLAHPSGGRQSVMQMEPGCEAYGDTIVALLNGAAPAAAPQSGAVERDAERLDFMLAEHAVVETDGAGNWRVAREWMPDCPEAYGPYAKDQRSAIDAALTASGGDGKAKKP